MDWDDDDEEEEEEVPEGSRARGNQFMLALCFPLAIQIRCEMCVRSWVRSSDARGFPSLLKLGTCALFRSPYVTQKQCSKSKRSASADHAQR